MQKVLDEAFGQSRSIGWIKDVWHIERDGKQVKRDLERQALQATGNVDRIEKQLLKQWDDALFEEQYIPAVTKEERLYAQHDEFCCWYEHLCDALEVVARCWRLRQGIIIG